MPNPTYGIAVGFARLSNWINAEGFIQSGMTQDHWTDHRVLKVCEESGEVFNALHNARGGNPRKVGQNTMEDVIEELLDEASAALCAVEHLTGHQCESVNLLLARLTFTLERVGIPIRD